MSNIDENLAFRNFSVGDMYTRMEVAQDGDVTPPKRPRDWSGIVRFKNCVLLFVTLNKGNFEQDIQYNDIFDDAGRLFHWESQNKNTQKTPAIENLIAGQPAILFARIQDKIKSKTQPFVYAGRLDALHYENKKPVKFVFRVVDYTLAPTKALKELYRWKEDDPVERKPAISKVSKRKNSGQGRSIDPKKKKAIELHAMETARKHYEAENYLVVDTSDNFPYDFECRKAGELRRVEVKGTTMDPCTVNVTYNEVESARGDGCETDLFITHKISIVEKAGDYVCHGGQVKLIKNWLPNDEDLTPTAYTYRVP